MSLKANSEEQFDEGAIQWIEVEHEKSGADASIFSEDEDEKWDEACEIGRKHGHISASFLQRSLKIGYNRAARMVEFYGISRLGWWC